MLRERSKFVEEKDEKTNKLVQRLFKDDKPQGIFKYYYPFDSVKVIMNFKQDGKIAIRPYVPPDRQKNGLWKIHQ